jgi:hypothetical protein
MGEDSRLAWRREALARCCPGWHAGGSDTPPVVEDSAPVASDPHWYAAWQQLAPFRRRAGHTRADHLHPQRHRGAGRAGDRRQLVVGIRPGGVWELVVLKRDVCPAGDVIAAGGCAGDGVNSRGRFCLDRDLPDIRPRGVLLIRWHGGLLRAV